MKLEFAGSADVLVSLLKDLLQERCAFERRQRSATVSHMKALHKGFLERRAKAAAPAPHDGPRKHEHRPSPTAPTSCPARGNVSLRANARLEAAVRIGLADVPVVVAGHWSASQVKAYRLADNQLARHTTWDERLLRIEIQSIIDLDEVSIEVMGWETAEIDVLLGDTAIDNTDVDDDLPVEDANVVAQLGDIWLLGKHRLLCGSSMELESWGRLMNGAQGAMVLTDAPFNVPVNGHVSGSGRHAEFAMASGEMSEAEFTAFNEAYLRNMTAHLKDGAIVMAFMDHKHLYELMTAARAADLQHLNLCVWSKTNGGMGSLYRSQHELLLVLKHGKAPHTNTVQLGKHGSKSAALRVNVRHRDHFLFQQGAVAGSCIAPSATVSTRAEHVTP